MTKDDNDPVKKIFGKTAQDIFSTPSEPHCKFHSPNAFCSNAGPEEMKHFQDLLNDLSDSQVAILVDAVGIKFGHPTKDMDRDTLIGVLDESDREVFYREYRNLTTS